MRSLVIASLAFALCPAASTAQNVSYVNNSRLFRRAKVVYRSCSTTAITLSELATWTAPILWFSPDEPLLENRVPAMPLIKRPAERKEPSSPPLLPTAMPYDPESSSSARVVYAWVRKIFARRTSAADDITTSLKISKHDPLKRLWDDVVDVHDIEALSIRYLFYYPFDIGTEPHKHDLESMELYFSVQHPIESHDPAIGCPEATKGIEVAIRRASGSAHGIGWFTNTLNSETADDVLLPLTVLVEEGKHASAPDRNGDGVYTPGYDVNVQEHDAWGVRDTMRANWIDNPAYRPEMNKVRLLPDRVYPPLQDADFMDYLFRRHEAIDDHTTRIALDKIHERQYQLRPLPVDSNLCDGFQINKALKRDQAVLDVDNLKAHEFYDLLKEQETCRQPSVYAPAPDGLGLLEAAIPHVVLVPDSRAYEHIGQRFAITWRKEAAQYDGISFTAPVGHAFAGYWLVAKINLQVDSFSNHSVSTLAYDAHFSPSASRFLDWYADVGVERRRTDIDNTEWHSAQEMGIRFRFPILKLPLKFWGVRAGVRINDFDQFRNPRFVLEAGGGSW